MTDQALNDERNQLIAMLSKREAELTNTGAPEAAQPMGEIDMPAEVIHQVEARNQIWQEYASAKGRQQEIDAVARQVRETTGRAETIQPLTAQQLPHEEVSRAVSEIRTALKEIEDAERQIASTQAQIRSVEARAKSRTYTLIAVALFIIAVIIVLTVL
jgi:septation ring formation regulator EzrA